MNKEDKIYVAGATGLVGSSVVRTLRRYGYKNILTDRVELMIYDNVKTYFDIHRPKYVFVCAAQVGGILANNTYPADFIRNNLTIQSNIIDAMHRYDVEKYVFLGSSCIYPRNCEQPIKESYLMTGELEPTNSAYAVAKIAGIEMVKAYKKQYGLNGICLMPTNLFGPNDNFDLHNSHVLPALIRKIHEAKANNSERVEVWGSGFPRREFLYVDDFASACILLMNEYESDEIINVGTGEDISIKSLVDMIIRIIGYTGKVLWNMDKPDGTPRKLLDISKLKSFGWYPKISLSDGIMATYEWYLNNA